MTDEQWAVLIKIGQMTLPELRAFAKENHITIHHTLKVDMRREIEDVMLSRWRKQATDLRELFNETLIRLVAANEAAGGGFMDARYCELLESHGIEVDGC